MLAMTKTMPSRRPIVVYLAAAFIGLSAIGALVSFLFLSPGTGGLDGALEDTVALIRSWGAWGVFGSLSLMVAHSFVPFPAELVGVANGMVFGPIAGTVVTWVGAMLGAFVAFGAVRVFGQPLVRRMLSVHQQQELAVWSSERGGTSLLVGRFIPVIAFNLLNYAAALTTMSWWTFAWATGIGILPLTILLNVFGEHMLTTPLWAWLASGAIAASAWLLWHVRWQDAYRARLKQST
jgi:uncharacterized membrane protein YdjX (TVP38/TMEM64 family)